jgi:hypothetical protein
MKVYRGGKVRKEQYGEEVPLKEVADIDLATDLEDDGPYHCVRGVNISKNADDRRSIVDLCFTNDDVLALVRYALER